jgi:hypothetical protein
LAIFSELPVALALIGELPPLILKEPFEKSRRKRVHGLGNE